MLRFALLVAATGLSTAAFAADAPSVEFGKHISIVGGCHDCHTPWKMGPSGPEPDTGKLLAGHPEQVAVTSLMGPDPIWMSGANATNTAWAGPWGVSFTRNLTPDKETGIGAWTADEFVATIKSGRKQGRGRELLPPMPWPQYRFLPDEDLKALAAYLATR